MCHQERGTCAVRDDRDMQEAWGQTAQLPEYAARLRDLGKCIKWDQTGQASRGFGKIMSK